MIDLADDEDGVRLSALLGGEWDKPLAALPPPYPGMKAFEENESAHFFGREADIGSYIDYLRLNHFLGLIGPSGCGKSSLVHAGIVPLLKKRSHCDLFGGGDWAVHVFRAGSPDFHAWLASFSGSNSTETERVQELLSAGEDQASRLLLVVDQFEELFSLDRPEEGRRQGHLGEKAIQTLQQFARLVGVPSVYVILTVRDEFYPQIILCQEWLKFHAHLHPVGSLSRKGLQDAIVLPARGVGVYIQDELVERLLNDAGDDPGILPFVQETMRSLWARMEAREITLASYVDLGTKEVNGLRHSIAARADYAFNSLPSDKHRDIAKRIFIRLIQFGEGRPDTRRQQSVASLKTEQESDLFFYETLDSLSAENNRLLTVSKNKNDDADVVVDIVHESLIWAWPKLINWINSYKGSEEKRRILGWKINEWKRLGGNKSGLLDYVEINEIDSLMSKSDWVFSGLSFDLKDFLSKSRESIDPGWSFKGVLFILLFGFSLLSFFVYVLLLINEYRYFYVKSIFVISTIIFLFFIFYFFGFYKREKTNKEKHISHFVYKSKYLIAIIMCFLLFVSVLWGVYGKEKLILSGVCEKKGYDVSLFGKRNILVTYDSPIPDEDVEGYKNLLIDFLGKSNHNFIDVSRNDNSCLTYSDYELIYKVSKVGLVDESVKAVLIRNNETIFGESIVFGSNVIGSKCDAIVKLALRVNSVIKDGFFIAANNKDWVNGDVGSNCESFLMALDAYKLHAEGNIDGAIVALLKAIGIDASNKSYNYGLGALYSEKQDYSSALPYIKKAVEKDRSNLKYIRTLIGVCSLLPVPDHNCVVSNGSIVMHKNFRDLESYDKSDLIHRIFNSCLSIKDAKCAEDYAIIFINHFPSSLKIRYDLSIFLMENKNLLRSDFYKKELCSLIEEGKSFKGGHHFNDDYKNDLISTYKDYCS